MHRCIQKHWIWQDANRFKWWVDLLLRANHEDKKILFDGTLRECKRGEVLTSLSKLAESWGVSRDIARHFLNMLESDSMIIRKTTQKYTQIIIYNYASYQDIPTTDPQANHNTPTTHPQLTHTNNNYNNDNNINILSKESNGEASGEAPKRTQKGVKKKAFVKPTVEEVEAYCKERQNGIDANAFMDHYEANGWKVGKGGLPMKDWQAVVRTWEKYKRYDSSNSTPARPENNPLANQQWRDPSRTEKWDFESSTDFD